MNVLLFGSSGMLGYDLNKSLSKAGVTVFSLTRQDCDVSNEEAIFFMLESHKNIDYVINCTAYTKVDLAETEQELANLINAKAVLYLAKACKRYKIPFVHFSTDYVFDGSRTNYAYLETDPCDPINAYGYSKWLGEQHCINTLSDYYLFRVQWLYGTNGPNFVKTMVSLMQTKQELTIVSDQWGTPTATASLADYVTYVLLNKPDFGIYHCTDLGNASWYDFATSIASKINYTGTIHPVDSNHFIRPAKRPKNGILSCEKLDAKTTLKRYHWKDMLANYLNDNIQGEKQ